MSTVCLNISASMLKHPVDINESWSLWFVREAFLIQPNITHITSKMSWLTKCRQSVQTQADCVKPYMQHARSRVQIHLMH